MRVHMTVEGAALAAWGAVAVVAVATTRPRPRLAVLLGAVSLTTVAVVVARRGHTRHAEAIPITQHRRELALVAGDAFVAGVRHADPSLAAELGLGTRGGEVIAFRPRR